MSALSQTPRDHAVVPLRDGLMITWRAECFRSSATGQALDIPVHYVWFETGPGKFRLAVRYLRSAVRTFAIVWRARPQVIVVNNLPVVAVLVVLLARMFNRHRIVMDFHSGGFSHPFWSRFVPVYRHVARRAPFTLAHNHQDGARIADWGARVVHMTALPRLFPEIERCDAPEQPEILMVCSFQPDEPIDMLIEVARRLPHVRFAMTGNHHKAGLTPSDVPGNMTLLGFVPHDEYLRRMAASTAVATFSDRAHIMQMALHEAISLGVPVITNRSQTLERVMQNGGVYCTLQTDAVVDGVLTAVAQARELRIAAGQLKTKRVEDVQMELEAISATCPDLFRQQGALSST